MEATTRCTAFRSSGWAVAFGDLRDCCAAAARDVLDCTPRLARGQHAGDTFVAAGVFWTPLVSTFGLGLRLSLCLPTPTIVVIFPGNSGEHVEQHAVDRFEHTPSELIAGIGGHDPRRRQVQRHDPDATGRQLGFQPFPVSGREPRQPVDLFYQQDVAGLGVGQQPEQFRPSQLGARLVLGVPGRLCVPKTSSELMA